MTESQFEPWLTNFTVRFLYEVYFELFFCLMISVAFMDSDMTEIWYIALSVLIVSLLLGPLATSLLFYLKSPMYKHGYEKKSLL